MSVAGSTMNRPAVTAFSDCASSPAGTALDAISHPSAIAALASLMHSSSKAISLRQARGSSLVSRGGVIYRGPDFGNLTHLTHT